MRPLAGVKVLDLTQYRSGPVTTEILLDLGAEVVKFENANIAGDPNRHLLPKDGIAYEILSTSRGKKSVIVDFHNEEIRELFLRLVEEADIVVENFKPGTMEKLGIGYETLKKRNPSVILTSISGYGRTGKKARRGAYDMAVQAASGFMSLTGEADGPPMKAGLSLADMQAGLWGAIGTLAALREREKTGEGTHVDIAMLDCMLYLADAQVTKYFVTGEEQKRIGNHHHASTPFQPFPCKNGEYVFICCPKQPQFESLCEGLGHPEIAEDPRFVGNENRHAHEKELEEELGSVTAQWDAKDLCGMLERRNLPFNVLNTLKEAVSLPEVAEREMLTDVTASENGKTYHSVATPVHMDGMERQTRFRFAKLGEDTFDIFRPFRTEEELHRIFDGYFEKLDEIAETYL